MSRRVVFMGTPHFAVTVLDAIIDAGHDVVAVYAQPPRRSGRGMATQNTPVHDRADALKLPVFTPLNFKNDDTIAAFKAHDADVAVVVAYGLLLPDAVLNAPRHGCYNVHASCLPRWRGAAPIQRAIMARDAETGVSIMRMESGLDTGPVCAESRLPIQPTTTADVLHDALSVAGASLMVAALRDLEAGWLRCTPQPETGVTYAKKISKAEARIDFSNPSEVVVAHIHGLSPFPGAWFELLLNGRRERIKILSARAVDGRGTSGTVLSADLHIACGRGAVQPLTLQRSGKKAVTLAEFLRGASISEGMSVLPDDAH